MKQEINNQKVRKRLLQLADFYNVKGLSGLAKHLEVSNATVYGWVRNGRIGDTGVILAKTPSINREWLLTGEGAPPDKTIQAVDKWIASENRGPSELTNHEREIAMTRIEQKMMERSGLTSKNDQLASEQDVPFSIDPSEYETVKMTLNVIRSETVYRKALISNVIAFDQAVKGEHEMGDMKEHMERVEQRMERMEKLLLTFTGSTPLVEDEKKQAGNDH